MQNIITNMNVSITPSGAVPSGAVPTPTFTNYSPFTTLLSEIPEEERNNYVGRKGIAIDFDEIDADSSSNGFFPNGTSVDILEIEPDCVRVKGIDKRGRDAVWNIGLDKLLVIPESDSSKPEPPESTEPKSKKTTKYIEPIEYPPITVDFSGALWNP
jgi:hypothetical protein